MSDDLRLPDELAAFEALLAAKPLATVGIDRDQLMYRAGWAAGEAGSLQGRPLAGGRFEAPETPTVTRRYPPAEPGAARGRRRTVAWSVVSAAVAASLAVFGTLAWESSAKFDDTEGAGGGTPRLAAVEALPAILAPVESPTTSQVAFNVAAADVQRLLDSNDSAGRITLAGPWFAMKRRGLNTSPSDALVQAEGVAATSDATPPSAKSARELWKELNPHKTATPTPVWPWGRSNSGDSI